MINLEELIKDKKGNKIKVNLIGRDGNAFAILGACNRAMQDAGVLKEVRDSWYTEATSGDYDKLLRTALKYFDVL